MVCRLLEVRRDRCRRRIENDRPFKHSQFELQVLSNRLYRLIAGKRAMTADTALRLEQGLGVEAAFWMNLQKSYELDLASEQIGEEIKRTIHRRSLAPQEQATAA